MNINWKVDNIHGKYITAKEALKLGIAKQVVLDGIHNKDISNIRIPELLINLGISNNSKFEDF